MARAENDYYRTPDWCADIGAMIAMRHGKRVLDPCAGDGSLMRAAERAGCSALGIEIDTARALLAYSETLGTTGVRCLDALTMDEWPSVDVILMNPPFSNWQAFLERAVDNAPTVALLRINALAGQKRADWWRSIAHHNHVRVHVLSRRPSFVESGKTDGCEYAWFEVSPFTRPGLEWV